MPISLPKLETPTYSLIIPSTNNSIEYRPYLVSEEKILMLAMESQKSTEIFKAIEKIISKCTFEKFDVSEITTFDMEYIFLKLRSKSVGETSTIHLNCEQCGKKNEVEINMEEIEVSWPEKKPESKFLLDGKIGLELRYPRLKDTFSFDPDDKKLDELSEGLKVMSKCIKSIYDEKNVYLTDDYTDKELGDFIESLNHSQVEKIKNFVSQMPKVEMKVNYKCLHCGHENKIVITGINNFFS